MLEKPTIPDEQVITAIQREYGLSITQLAFLPLGADMNTAVYRLETDDTAYFLKLRRGDFNELSLEIPLFLKTNGLRAIIAPLATQSGQLSAHLGEYRLILYPFIAGKDGYEVALPASQWPEFGATLRGIHTAQLPPVLYRRLPREDFSPRWREMVKRFQAQAESKTFSEPTALQLAAFMREKQADITQILARADELGGILASQLLDFVLCHSDIHPGNLLITAETFYLVDWDQPILAPKERDLVLLGGGAVWNNPRELELFFQGYGLEQINRQALAYYRYERIIQDLAVECEMILASNEGGDDREQEYRFFVSNFLPGHEIELARQTEHEIS